MKKEPDVLLVLHNQDPPGPFRQIAGDGKFIFLEEAQKLGLADAPMSPGGREDLDPVLVGPGNDRGGTHAANISDLEGGKSFFAPAEHRIPQSRITRKRKKSSLDSFEVYPPVPALSRSGPRICNFVASGVLLALPSSRD